MGTQLSGSLELDGHAKQILLGPIRKDTFLGTKKCIDLLVAVVANDFCQPFTCFKRVTPLKAVRNHHNHQHRQKGHQKPGQDLEPKAT